VLHLSDCPTFWGISAQAVLELIPSITMHPMVEPLCPGKSAADLQAELSAVLLRAAAAHPPQSVHSA
jgi:predicted cobalt transporter CbtA